MSEKECAALNYRNELILNVGASNLDVLANGKIAAFECPSWSTSNIALMWPIVDPLSPCC